MIASSALTSANARELLAIVSFSLFIYGLSNLTGPRTAVRGNRLAAIGMAIADRRDPASAEPLQRPADRAGRRRGSRRRRARSAPRQDDPDAADGRALQRRRRRRRGVDRMGRVPELRRLRRGRDQRRRVQPVRRDHREHLLLGLAGRFREAAGAAPGTTTDARSPADAPQRSTRVGRRSSAPRRSSAGPARSGCSSRSSSRQEPSACSRSSRSVARTCRS